MRTQYRIRSGRQPSRLGRRLLFLLAWFTVLAPGHLFAQAPSWEYSPYRIRLVIALEPGVFPESVRDEVGELLRRRARVVAGVTWNLSVTAPPTAALAGDVQHHLDVVTAEQIEAQLKLRESELQAAAEGAEKDSPEAADLAEQAIDWGSVLSTRDKLLLVSLQSAPQGYRVQARELCCHTRQLGPLIARQVFQREYLPEAAFQAVVDAFLPIIRIEENERKTATAAIRAGGLIVDPANPSMVETGSVLYPVIRRNDRVGNPAEGGIRMVDWTYMEVTERTESDVACDIHSGYRAPLGGRTSRRIDKYGLLVKTQVDATVLHVETRGDSPRPLAGYEIFAQDPATEESERVGLTDWRGQIVIQKPPQKPITMLYVKNGGMLLARLPMVPGYEPEMRAQMVDDEGRLEAEAFVRGMQGRMMDLIAKREFLASKIRRNLEEGKVDEARKLLDEFRLLPSFSELDATLDRKKNDVVSSDSRTQRSIDQLFSKTHELLVKYLDPKQADQLESEISRARSGG